MTVPVPGGTRELETPALLRDRPSVTDALVIELATLALRLEGGAGIPVDIECAIHDNDVYLLQSRPITTLRRASGDERGVR
jgi:phosphoenolpyruvate synthase/pyruvate phosphate dikinase